MKTHSAAVVVAVLLLLPCYAPAAETSSRTEWEKTVAAAEKEGQLVIYRRVSSLLQLCSSLTFLTAESGINKEYL
jgi:hypothetical protein